MLLLGNGGERPRWRRRSLQPEGEKMVITTMLSSAAVSEGAGPGFFWRAVSLLLAVVVVDGGFWLLLSHARNAPSRSSGKDPMTPVS